MQQALRELWALQQVDTQVFELQRGLARLDTGADAAHARDSAKEIYDQAAANLHRIQTELTDLDLKTKSAEAKRKDFEGRMYSGKVTAAKELDAMAHEIQMLARTRDTLETRELELMEELTPARIAAAEAKAALDEAEKAVKAIVAESADRRVTLQSQLAEAVKAREAQAAKLQEQDASLYRKYEGLRAKLANVAVAPVEKTACGVCHVSISGYLLKDLKAGESTMTCESCGRILYYEG